MSSYKSLRYEKKGHLAYVTLDRPDRLNAINPDMRQELPEVWRDVRDDPNVWVAILTGAGDKAFCAGVDIKNVASGHQPMPKRFGEWPITPKQNYCWKPVILALNGMCVGGGMTFLADSDLVVAAEHATIFDTHTTVGLVSALEAIRVARKISYNEVMRMALCGKGVRMTAQRAYELGLVNYVVPKERLMERATQLAEQVCQNAPLAIQGSVEALWGGFQYGYTQATERAFKIVQENFFTEDFLEGPQAFTEKRKPQWKAR